MPALSRRRTAAAALALTLAAGACGRSGAAPGSSGGSTGAAAAAPAAHNLPLVSIDTLRADALGTYGNPRGASPASDAFAETPAVLEDSRVSSPWTPPGWATGAVTTHPYVSDRYGPRQGSEDFGDGILGRGRRAPHEQVSSSWVHEHALARLRVRGGPRWFPGDEVEYLCALGYVDGDVDRSGDRPPDREPQ